MRIFVRHGDTEIEVSVPDFGPETTASTTSSGWQKYSEIYTREKKSYVESAISIIKESVESIKKLKEDHG